MTATNHDDQLGEIYQTMLNELNCTFGVNFSRLHCCGHHGHGLWPSWFVAIVVCGRHGIGPYKILPKGKAYTICIISCLIYRRVGIY